MKKPKDQPKSFGAAKSDRKENQAIENIEESIVGGTGEESTEWMMRPRLPMWILLDAMRLEDKVVSAEKAGGRFLDDTPQKLQEKYRRIELAVKKFGWSNERLTECKHTVAGYLKNPSIKNYVAMRRKFPELEVDIKKFSDPDTFAPLKGELKKQKIDPGLVLDVFDGQPEDIDALSMRLLELLVAKDELPKQGPGHLQKRRDAISDAMANFLIVTMLETFDWHENVYRVPDSLIVLIRQRLCGEMPDLRAAALSWENRLRLARHVGGQLKPNEKLSVRKLAKIAKIPSSTAGRLLKDEEFKRWVANGRRDQQNILKAWIK